MASLLLLSLSLLALASASPSPPADEGEFFYQDSILSFEFQIQSLNPNSKVLIFACVTVLLETQMY